MTNEKSRARQAAAGGLLQFANSLRDMNSSWGMFGAEIRQCEILAFRLFVATDETLGHELLDRLLEFMSEANSTLDCFTDSHSVREVNERKLLEQALRWVERHGDGPSPVYGAAKAYKEDAEPNDLYDVLWRTQAKAAEVQGLVFALADICIDHWRRSIL